MAQAQVGAGQEEEGRQENPARPESRSAGRADPVHGGGPSGGARARPSGYPRLGDSEADFKRLLPQASGPWLAISGGGSDGAFGGGLLTGWSQSGNRPEFAAVTGASIGALIAPYAFLGSALR